MIAKRRLDKLLNEFASEMKIIFGENLVEVILFGSYATGCPDDESDIDVMILVNIDKLSIKEYRGRVIDVIFRLDFEYDVLLSPIIQNFEEFESYKNASGFFKNVERQGVKISA